MLMARNARLVVFAAVATLTVVMGVIDTLAYRSKVEHNEVLLRDGISATAGVVDYRRSGRSAAEVSFRVLDGRYGGFTDTRTVYRGPRKFPGDPITVVQAADDANDLLIVGYDQDVRILGWVFATATAGLGLDLLFGRGRRRSGG